MPISKEVFNKLPLGEKMRFLPDVIQKKTTFTAPTLEEAKRNEGGDGGWLENIRIEEDGSIRIWLQGHPEPMRIWPDSKVVLFTAVYKRLLTIIASNFKTQGWISRIIALLYFRKNINVMIEWLTYIFEIYPALLNEENYSQPVKEIRRVLKDKLHQSFIDAISLVIEFDAAYRYRFQDIVAELDNTNLWYLQGVKKEVLRLLDIVILRESGQNPDNDKWRNIRKMVKVALWSPKICQMIGEILKDIDIDKVKLSKEDIYWTNQYGLYSYRGLTYQQRRDENMQNYEILKGRI